MQADIITIGDEILIGQVVDTNSAWLAEQLLVAGISVRQITSVSDSKEHIMAALTDAAAHSPLVLTTGGLGPTRDDITKQVLCDFFQSKLVFNPEIFEDVKRFFASLGKEVLEVNRRQAEVPEAAVLFRNKQGTAPGMWFEKGKTVFVSLPGVPYEMKALMQEQVLPKIKAQFKPPRVVQRTVLTQGIGESFIAELVSEWETSLEKEGIRLAYLPSPGMVRLRLGARGNNENELHEKIERKIKELEQLLPEYVFGRDKQTLEAMAGDLLRQKGFTLATAESCTGGYIAHLITTVPGSSAYFKGAVVSYANDVKTKTLGVKEKDISRAGAVSREVAEQMAEGVKKLLQTDCSIAVSGIAGPDGGSLEKPVGTVWIAVSTPSGTISEKFLFGQDRGRNIRKSALTALHMLKKALSG